MQSGIGYGAVITVALFRLFSFENRRRLSLESAFVAVAASVIAVFLFTSAIVLISFISFKFISLDSVCAVSERVCVYVYFVHIHFIVHLV